MGSDILKEKLLDYVKKNGVVRTRELNDLLVPRVYLSRLVSEGRLERISRGLYQLPDNEITEHTHVAGALSMANSGPNTNGCQFFITYEAKHGLDGDYSVFGQLIGGMDILEKLTPRDPSQNPKFEGDKIIRIIIEEK